MKPSARSLRIGGIVYLDFVDNEDNVHSLLLAPPDHTLSQYCCSPRLIHYLSIPLYASSVPGIA
eukprot:1440495-Rhodomonas_salina.2